MAALRGDVECPTCHSYIDPKYIVTWNGLADTSDAMCRDCWYDQLEEAERRNLITDQLTGRLVEP